MDPEDAREAVQQPRAAAPALSGPVVTSALVAINAAVFIYITAQGISLLGGRLDEYLHFGANFAPLTNNDGWWRLITSLFVHLGIVHLAFNLVALWESGRLAEPLLGHAWFAALYMFGGIAGACASMIWNQDTISAGASAPIFGIYGALLAYLALRPRALEQSAVNRLRISAGIFITYALFYGFARNGLDNAAHIGGLAAGGALGVIAGWHIVSTRGISVMARAVVAAMVISVTLCTAFWIMPDTTHIYRQALTLQKGVAAFSAQEDRLSEEFQSVVERNRDGKMSDAAALAELRDKILPGWNDAVARLAAVELDVNSALRVDYDLLMRYATARRETIKAVADYLENDSPEHARAIREMRAQADEALRKYQQRQRR